MTIQHPLFLVELPSTLLLFLVSDFSLPEATDQNYSNCFSEQVFERIINEQAKANGFIIRVFLFFRITNHIFCTFKASRFGTEAFLIFETSDRICHISKWILGGML